MQTQTARDGTENVTMRVLDAIATVRDVDPVTLTPPLASVLDPDALDALATADGDVAIQFTYAGCHVAVRGDDVAVTLLDDGQ